MTKTCNRCKICKPLSAFTYQGKRHVHRAACKDCVNLARNSKYVYSKSDDTKQAQRRNNQLLWCYGITTKDYERMFIEQNGQCAICLIKLETLCVDHCHKTLTIRGLICATCNKGLGCFKDDKQLVQSAFLYLSKERPLPTIEQLLNIGGGEK